MTTEQIKREFWPPSDRLVGISCALAFVAVVYRDLMTPLGYAAGAPHILVVLAAATASRRSWCLVAGIAAVIATVTVALVVERPDPHIWIENRLISVIVIAATSVYAWWEHGANALLNPKKKAGMILARLFGIIVLSIVMILLSGVQIVWFTPQQAFGNPPHTVVQVEVPTDQLLDAMSNLYTGSKKYGTDPVTFSRDIGLLLAAHRASDDDLIERHRRSLVTRYAQEKTNGRTPD